METCLNCGWASWRVPKLKETINDRPLGPFELFSANWREGGQCRWQLDADPKIPKGNFLGGGGVIHMRTPYSDCPQWKKEVEE